MPGEDSVATSATPPRVAILGGTGRLGPGLARHFARAGTAVIIGSREPARAADAAAALTGPGLDVRGMTNADAADAAEIIVLTLPHEGLTETLAPRAASLAGKVVVSAVVPMTFVDRRPVLVEMEGGSAARSIARILPGAKVTAAFHSVSSGDLAKDGPLDADTLICGDDPEALAATSRLAGLLPGLRPVVAGGLHLAAHIEAMTVVLLSINRRHHVTAGVRITHLGDPAQD